MSQHASATTGKFTGWHMLIIMVLFFGVIITVNMTMAVLAGRSWTGLVVKNSYVASQKFNDELLEAKRQQARGWKSGLAYTAGQLSFELQDREGRPVVLTDMKAAVGRPASEQQDHTISLAHVGGGKYRADTKLAPGHWMVKVQGGSGERAFRRDARLFVGKEPTSKAD